MPTPTYTLLDSVTLGSSASSVTFSSIDQSYGDYVLSMNLTTAGNATFGLRFNNDTGTNYHGMFMDGNGTATESAKWNPSDRIILNTYSMTLNTSPSLVTVQIFDATATDKHKSVLTRGNRVDKATTAIASRWASTAAINRIDILQFTLQDFTTGSTFFLYGIEK